jgi:hypothetical protein
MMEEIIRLDAGSTSSLDWSLERKSALSALAAGKKVLWFLDLGLFDRLKMPLSHPSQFLTLGLAVDHFRDAVWKEFRSFSSGVCLYRGSSNFSEQLQWDEPLDKAFDLWLEETQTEKGDFTKHLFCVNACSEYLKQLAERIPEELPAYLIYNSLPEDVLEKALFTNPERFGRIQVHASAPFTWKTHEESKIGLLMPPLDAVLSVFLDPFRKAIQEYPSAKLIPEERLTYAWEGLETLIYSEKCLSKQGKRKVQGFIAAGGEVKNIII